MVDFILACHQIQLIGPNLAINTNSTCKDVQLTHIGSIESFAFDCDLATFYSVTCQIALIIELSTTCCQHTTRAIDKSTAITGDAVRIGDDNLCCSTGNLCITPQLTGVATDNFIQNDACRLTCQCTVTIDIPSLLSQNNIRRVVEKSTLLPNIKMFVFITRHTIG